MTIIEKLKKPFQKKSNTKDPIKELYKEYLELKIQLKLVTDKGNKEMCEWLRDNIQLYIENWHTFRKSFEQYNGFLKKEIDAFKKIKEKQLEK